MRDKILEIMADELEYIFPNTVPQDPVSEEELSVLYRDTVGGSLGNHPLSSWTIKVRMCMCLHWI